MYTLDLKGNALHCGAKRHNKKSTKVVYSRKKQWGLFSGVVGKSKSFAFDLRVFEPGHPVEFLLWLSVSEKGGILSGFYATQD